MIFYVDVRKIAHASLFLIMRMFISRARASSRSNLNDHARAFFAHDTAHAHIRYRFALFAASIRRAKIIIIILVL